MNAAAGAVPVSGITPNTEAYGWLTGGLPGSGRLVTERSAMCVSAVIACVQLIGGAIASLPLKTYRRDADGVPRRTHTALTDLFNQEFHPCWSAPVAWEFIVQSILLHGDGFIRVHRKNRFSPDIRHFEPLHPLTVDPRRTPDDRLAYVCHANADGAAAPRIEVIDQDDMLHFPGAGFNGLRGISLLQHALREPVSISLHAGEQAVGLLSDGLRPDLVIKHGGTKKLDQAEIDRLRGQWLERYGAGSNRYAPIILSGDMDVKQISVSPEDAQLLDTRKMSVEDICRIFGVQPFMVGQTEKTTSFGSGVADLGIGFKRYTLMRHLKKIQSEANRKLYRGGVEYCEFDTAALEQGDTKSRYEAYRTALGRAGEDAWLLVNDIRRLENLPPVEGGDILKKGSDHAPKQDPAAAA